MPQSTRRWISQKVDELRNAPQLLFHDLLDPATVNQVLDKNQVSFRDRIFSPLVTLWTFLSQVLSLDHFLPRGRRPLDRLSRLQRPGALSPGDRQLLQGPPAPPFEGHHGSGPGHRTASPGASPGLLALERAGGRAGRRQYGLDARHRGQSGGVSATQFAETRRRISSGPIGRRHLADYWSPAHSGRGSVLRQGDRRDRAVPHTLGSAQGGGNRPG